MRRSGQINIFNHIYYNIKYQWKINNNKHSYYKNLMHFNNIVLIEILAKNYIYKYYAHFNIQKLIKRKFNQFKN